MRIVLVLLTLIVALPAFSEERPNPEKPECTKEYLRELDDEVLANKDVRRWTTDYLRPACRAIQRTESLTGTLFKTLRIDKAWDATLGKYIDIDPALTSKTCKYFRRLGERVLTPDEDEERLRAEIKRCEHVRTQ